MDPKKGACPFPFLERIALCKPDASTFMTGIASNVVILVRIWRGQPMQNVPLQLVTCEAALTYMQKKVYEVATDVLSRLRSLCIYE